MRILLKKFSIFQNLQKGMTISKKNQSTRLTNQHKVSKGVIGIFGEDAKKT